MSLHVQQHGSGPSLVMLHGWGANSGVWASVNDALAEHFSLSLVDLPGHGKSDFDAQAMQDMATLADRIAEAFAEPAIWIGWSLGGMTAMNIAQRHPEKVSALINVASGPRFLQADDWPHAVDESVFHAFSKEVQNDPRAALKKFIALQTRGSETQREDARLLRDALLGDDMVKPGALDAGLGLLAKTDLRSGLGMVNCPVAMIAGENDTLHPPASIQSYVELLPNAMLKIIDGAGHAPFISHKNEFINTVLDFVKSHSDVLSEPA